MVKRKAAFVAVSVVIAVGVLLGLFLFRGQPEDESPPGQVPEALAVLDLGITYLTVTPESSAYYGLEVDSGALVTEVIPGSSAVRAGMEAGDVIISFNGVRLREGAPLLGMMRTCVRRIVVEVRRGGSTKTIELVPSF